MTNDLKIPDSARRQDDRLREKPKREPTEADAGDVLEKLFNEAMKLLRDTKSLLREQCQDVEPDNQDH